MKNIILKQLIREEIKNILLEQNIAAASVQPALMNVPAGSSSPSTPSIESPSGANNNLIAQKLQRMLVLMTNVGALIHNPNINRRSLTRNANSPNRAALDVNIFQSINKIQNNQMQSIVPELRNQITDPTKLSQLQMVIDTIVAVVPQLNTIKNTSDAQLPPAERINRLISVKNQYIGSTRILRQLIRQYQSVPPTTT